VLGPEVVGPDDVVGPLEVVDVLDALFPLLFVARATSTIATTSASASPTAAKVSRWRWVRRRASSTATMRAERFCSLRLRLAELTGQNVPSRGNDLGELVACAAVRAGCRSPGSPTALLLATFGVAVLALSACSSSAEPASSRTTSTGGRAAATTTTRPPAVAGPVVRTSQQRLSPVYAQGVARIPGGWVFSGTNSLSRTDNSLQEIVHVGPAIPDAWKAKGYDHIGDIDVVGKYIYAPFEEPDYSKGHQATARYDRDTLRFVDAVVLPQHQNSFVTVDPATMTAYSMDEFDGGSLLRYDVARGWKPLAPFRMSEVLHHTQGADVYGGAIWISTDDAQKGVYRVDLRTGRVALVAKLGHPGGEGEGIDASALASGFLHVLCVDPKYVPVWFEHFRA